MIHNLFAQSTWKEERQFEQTASEGGEREEDDDVEEEEEEEEKEEANKVEGDEGTVGDAIVELIPLNPTCCVISW